MKVKCEKCGIIFDKPKCYIKRTKRNFCCKECEKLFKIKRNKIIIKDNHAEIIINSPKYGEKLALIDLEDIDKVKEYTWTIKNARNNFYVQYSQRGQKTLPLHRLIMDCPDDLVIDHLNHDTLDNRKYNLRICTQFENLQNKKSNTSGRTGVSYYKKNNKWTARIIINGNRKFLGYFETFEDAVNIMNIAEQNRDKD